MLNLISVVALAATLQSGLQVNTQGRNTSITLANGEVVRVTNNRVSNLREVEVAGDTRVITWQEALAGGRSDWYAISLDGQNVARVTSTDGMLHLRYREFDPLRGLPPVPEDLQPRRTESVFIVQFVCQPLDEFRRELASMGVEITHYLPTHAYIARMSEGVRSQVTSLPYVRWVGPYAPAYRIAPDFRGAGPYECNIQTLTSVVEENERLAAKLRAMGATVGEVQEKMYVLRARLTKEQIIAAAHEDEVLWIEPYGPPSDDMDIARQISGQVYVEGIAGYKGEGVRGEVLDSGCRVTHQAFQLHPLLVRSNSSSNSHGTSTTGIVFGSGAANAAGRGVLPEGQGIVAYYGSLGNRFTHTEALLQAPYYAVFQTNSWGSALTTAYTSDSYTMDDIIWRLDFLICQSQSNAGTTSSRPQAWAKNIVSVGGVNHLNTLTKADDYWNGASIGPAADGRIKPDFIHFYDNVLCTSNTSDTSYTSGFGGTSAATPITAGHFGIFYQMWADGAFGQTVTGNTVFDARPHAQTAKAVMAATASQYPFTGSAANLSRVKQGWGMIDVKNAWDNRFKLFIVNETDVLQNLQSRSYRMYVASGTPEFQATMIYADPPGTTSSTQHRINDLSLKVTSPSGVQYWGNNGLLDGNYSTSGGAANTKDTVENVIVPTPEPGVWTVEVIASEVNQDARLETPSVVDVDFALAVEGVMNYAQPQAMAVGPGNQVGGTVTDTLTSNNVGVAVRAGIVATPALPPARVEFTTNAAFSNPAEITFRVESSASTVGLMRKVELFDFLANQWVEIGSGAQTPGDSAVEYSTNSSPSRFVQAGSMQMRGRVSWKASGPVNSPNWLVVIDQVRWFLNP